MPFLGEELWQRLPKHPGTIATSVSIAPYPSPEAYTDRHIPALEETITGYRALVRSIRAAPILEFCSAGEEKPSLILAVSSPEAKARYSQMIDFVQ